MTNDPRYDILSFLSEILPNRTRRVLAFDIERYMQDAETTMTDREYQQLDLAKRTYPYFFFDDPAENLDPRKPAFAAVSGAFAGWGVSRNVNFKQAMEIDFQRVKDARAPAALAFDHYQSNHSVFHIDSTGVGYITTTVPAGQSVNIRLDTGSPDKHRTCYVLAHPTQRIYKPSKVSHA